MADSQHHFVRRAFPKFPRVEQAFENNDFLSFAGTQTHKYLQLEPIKFQLQLNIESFYL